MVFRLFFVYFAIGKNLFITNEDLFRYALLCAASGAAVNVLLNWMLIPSLHSQGAVLASITSLFVTVFLIDAFSFKDTIRANLRSMLHAMITPTRFGR
jgi:O-antigen/teichoic acid export membrane protein